MRVVSLLILACLAAGCAGGSRATWERAHGGVAGADARSQKVERALARLGSEARTVRGQVLADRQACAYAWGDGTVYVTCGLVDLLDEQELAAAVAHEVGHLIDGGHMACGGKAEGIRGALGGHGCTDVEARADALGVGVLRRAGVSNAQGVMGSMLAKVKGTVTGERRQSIERRIALLQPTG